MRFRVEASFAAAVLVLPVISAATGCSSDESSSWPHGAAQDASPDSDAMVADVADGSSKGGSAGTGGAPTGGSAGTGGTPDAGGSAGTGGDPNFTPDGCFKWAAQPALSLEQATAQHECVEVQPGTFVLDAPVPLSPGHTLRGVSADASILVANQATWSFGCCDSMITDTLPATPQDNPFHVQKLTLDGAGVATYNVCCRGYVAEGVVMKSSRCSALGIVGRGVEARNNTMQGSAQHTNVPGKGLISCASGGTGGVDEGAAIYSQGTGDDYACVIEGNTIETSYGPALDVNGAWGGIFRNNIVSANSAWAAVSLYGASNWLIENNQISHPNDQPPQPYHPYCATGPAGGHSAGIFLCQDTDQDNLVTNNNTIRGNKTASYYGILSVGADEVKPYFAPRNNTFENNDVFGSNFGCADDFKPGQWMTDGNTWSGNNCEGTPNTGPATF
ncbi:MAG: right-handed parallel beta-helix repeat-containing protein [Deltaproteobacteria bacterium]|nr:right-handed parallel beta-helix repeat-containing protein [Deltaproteobacteria bacterium]